MSYIAHRYRELLDTQAKAIDQSSTLTRISVENVDLKVRDIFIDVSLSVVMEYLLVFMLLMQRLMVVFFSVSFVHFLAILIY